MRKTKAKTKSKKGKPRNAAARKPAAGKAKPKGRTTRAKQPVATKAAPKKAAAPAPRTTSVWPGLPPGYFDRAR